MWELGRVLLGAIVGVEIRARFFGEDGNGRFLR